MSLIRRVCGACAILPLALTACDSGKSGGVAGSPAPPFATESAAGPEAALTPTLATAPRPDATFPPAPAPAAPGPDLSTPKGSLQRQLALLHEGKVEELKGCFTERQRDKITKEVVAQGKEQLEKMNMPFDDLVSRIEEIERDGKQAVRIHMKESDIVLTTLILTDGRWLSDTIWFR